MNKMCRTTNQTGRSMIEVLGVLAIIGVLSVGGIAGYSKAMTKYRINKTIDQITQISQNVRMLYGRQRQKNYRNLNTRILYKANLAPKEMFGSGYSMTNAWGREFDIIGLGDFFEIGTVISSEEACIELVTQDWGSSNTTGLMAIMAVNEGLLSNEEVVDRLLSSTMKGKCTGIADDYFAMACSGGSVVSVPMPVDVAVEVCEKGENAIMFLFQ